MARIYPGSSHLVAFRVSDLTATSLWRVLDQDRINIFRDLPFFPTNLVSVYRSTTVNATQISTMRVAGSGFLEKFILGVNYTVGTVTSRIMAAQINESINYWNRWRGWPIAFAGSVAYLGGVEYFGLHRFAGDPPVYIVQFILCDENGDIIDVVAPTQSFLPYFITSPGRRDSDGVVQATPPGDPTRSFVLTSTFTPPVPTVFSMRVTLIERNAPVIDATNTIAIAAEEIIEGVLATPGELGDTVGTVAVLENDAYILERIRPLSAQQAAVRLTRPLLQDVGA